MHKIIPLVLLLLINICANAQYSGGLDTTKLITQFMIKSWTTDEGLPSNAAIDIMQSQQGYLWVATYGGVSRFDGKDFNNFNSEIMETSSIETLIEDNEGVIWIGSHHGIYIYKDKTIQRHPLLSQFDKVYINELFLAKNGDMWIGTNSNGFFLFSNGKLINFNDKLNLSGAIVHEFAEDKQGNIYIGCESSNFFIYSKGAIKKINSQNTNGVFAINITDSNIWLGCGNGLFYLENNEVKQLQTIDVGAVNDIISDKYGLWLGTYSGLYRYFTSTGELQAYTEKEGFPNNIIRKIMYDKNQNLWVATYRKGIVMLSEGGVFSYSTKEGMSADIAASIIEYSPGEYWIGIEKGELNVLKNRKITKHKVSDKLPHTRLKSILKDSKNNVWLSTYGALVKVNGDKIKIYNKSTGLPGDLIRLTYEDSKGQLWIGTRTSGLHLFEDGKVIKTLNIKNGLSSNYIMCISEDRKGRLLVGTKTGINIIVNNEITKKYTIDSGLSSNLIFNMYADSSNTLWAATASGLARIKLDSVFNFTGKNSMLSNALFDILEDKNKFFWIPTNYGIIKVNSSDLNNLADSKINSLKYEMFDKSRGMRREECVGATKSIIDSNNNLWILTTGGVVKIDPNINTTENPHSLLIEKIISDNTIFYPQNNEILIPPGQRRIQIKYTTFEYRSPLKIDFKYKLEPFDKKWVEAGNQRIAPYTNLPPGKYFFHVKYKEVIDKKDSSTTIAFEILPLWYEAIWFKIAIAFLMLSIGPAWYKYRVYTIHQRNEILEKQVEERTKEIREKNKQLIIQKNELNAKNKKITHSIQYAKRIQDAVLPSVDLLKKYFSSSFIFFKPRDIVSGDFFWFHKIEHSIIIAAADCTGHGIPGAFMSLLSIGSINEIVKTNKELIASEVLNKLRVQIKSSLSHNEGAAFRKDGLDIALCIIDTMTLEMQYAGAYNPLIVLRKTDAPKIEIKKVKIKQFDDFTVTQVIADAMPIGVGIKERPFINNRIQLIKGDRIYIFSDGFLDQIGGNDGKKYMIKQFRKLIYQSKEIAMNEQEAFFNAELTNWQANDEQVDDILVIGIEI